MAGFLMLIWDLSPAAAHSAPPQMPKPVVDRYPEALLMFRSCLLKTPHGFDCRLRIPTQVRGRTGEFRIELDWTAAGDTCGIARWSNRDHTVALSILLNGLESIEDFSRLKGILA